METLYELWGKRNPDWEERYQDSVISVFSDYGKGVNKYQDARGKIYAAGYEVFILAFFIGLYHNQTKPLIADKSRRKGFGQPIMYWGNIEERNGRKPYGAIREYIFAALIARTDIDFIALDKGEITPRKAVDKLIDKMEQYANFGFDYIEEKLEQNPNYFFNETAFLRTFTQFVGQPQSTTATSFDDDDEAEDL